MPRTCIPAMSVSAVRAVSSTGYDSNTVRGVEGNRRRRLLRRCPTVRCGGGRAMTLARIGREWPGSARGFSGVEADSDRHRVDEQADYRFHAGHLWVGVLRPFRRRRRRRVREVRRARFPCHLYQGRHGQTAASRERPKSLGSFGRQRVRVDFTCHGFGGGVCPSRGGWTCRRPRSASCHARSEVSGSCFEIQER